MVRELIGRKGEQHLYEQLLEYLTEHNYTKSTKSQLERKALELHADRIFDNEAWVDFLKFNRKYRPEVAAATKVVYIRTECCSKPGAIPQTQLDSCKRIDKTSIPSKYCQSLCGLYPEASIFAYHGCVFCGKRCVWCVARNDIWEEMACSLETPEVGQLEAYSFYVGVVIFHSCRDGIRQYLEDLHLWH